MDAEGRRTVRASYSNIAASDHARQHLGDIYNISNAFALHCRRTLAVGNVEGIRLAACVSGLKNLTDNIVTGVDLVQAQLDQSSALPRSFVDGLVVSKTILTQLESQLRDISRISHERTSLVQADHLIISFTNGVLLFSDIQRYLQSLGAFEAGVTDDKSVSTSLAQRLDRQCSIWRAQLDMLQCSSDEEAYNEVDLLETLTSKLLAENLDLKRRMDSIESEITELSKRKRAVPGDFGHSVESIHELSSRVNLDLWEFEEILQESWVYKRNEYREEMMSFHSSIDRDDAWSELSRLTAAHLSVISVIALPVKSSELTDSSWYRNSITTAARTIRSRPLEKAKVHEKTPRSSPASKQMLEVVSLANALFNIDDAEWQVIQSIKGIASGLRAIGDANMIPSIDEAEDHLFAALFPLKEQRDDTSLGFSSLDTEITAAPASVQSLRKKNKSVWGSFLLDAGAETAFGYLLMFLRRSGIGVTPQSCHLPRNLSASVKGMSKETARTPSDSGATWSRNLLVQECVTREMENLRKKVPQTFCDLRNADGKSVGKRALVGYKQLDDLVFLCEGYTALDLSSKNLSTLPHRDLEAMTKKLHIIVLDDNRISFLEEAESSLGTVKVLQIRRNGLLQFPEVFMQLKLHSLDISHNYIDHIPPQVSEMPELQELAMQGNAFDELPAEVWKMDPLEKIYVQWTVWQAWCAANQGNVDWSVVERFDVGLYATGWVELERNRFNPNQQS